MTAPLFQLPEGALSAVTVDDLLTLAGAEGHHAVVVRRLRQGEELLLADGSGRVAECIVAEVGAKELVAKVQAVREAVDVGPRLVLVQALAKHERDEAAVEMATELGVDEVLAWQASRSVVIWRGERGARSLRKWGSVAAAAAKQSRRATFPEVTGPWSTAQIAERIAGMTAYVLHEEATTALAGITHPDEGEVALIVGPEGGISPAELELFTAAGALPVRLGDTVLRSSSAGPAGLAVVLSATRWRHT